MTLARQLGDEILLAETTQALGLAALLSGDLQRAVELLEEALERFTALGVVDTYTAVCHFELAAAYLFLGDLDRAAALCAEGVAFCETHGEQWALSYVLNTLVLVEFTRGDPRQATGYARTCLRIKQAFHDVVGIRMVVEELAWVAALEGAAERAARLLGAARMIGQTFGLAEIVSGGFVAAPTRSAWREPAEPSVTRRSRRRSRAVPNSPLTRPSPVRSAPQPNRPPPGRDLARRPRRRRRR